MPYPITRYRLQKVQFLKILLYCIHFYKNIAVDKVLLRIQLGNLKDQEYYLLFLAAIHYMVLENHF
ncbi:hypothetical protein B5F76_11445 [Desulfovibrio sp. An276]|nr:hypothetical protein B5F76_11445 [Desulfovibrio sp. An276]